MNLMLAVHDEGRLFDGVPGNSFKTHCIWQTSRDKEEEMTHLTRKTMQRFAAAMAMLCLSIIMSGCTAPPFFIQPIPSPTPSPPPVGVFEIGGIDEQGQTMTLQVAAAHIIAEWQLDQNALTDIQQKLKEPTYLEYALVFNKCDKGWRLYYAEPPMGIAQATRVVAYEVEEWQKNAQSLFMSRPIFEVASSSPIALTASVGTRLELEQGLELISNVNIDTSCVVDDVRDGETAYLLVSNGNMTNPTYTLVVMAGVQEDGKTPMEMLPYCVSQCSSSVHRPVWCLFCRRN